MTELSPWLVYWITRMTALNTIFEVAAVISLISSVILTILYCVSTACSEDASAEACANSVRPILKRVLPLCALVGLAWALTPTTKELCVIFVLPAVANSDMVAEVGVELSGVPGEMVELAREWMKELKPQQD